MAGASRGLPCAPFGAIPVAEGVKVWRQVGRVGGGTRRKSGGRSVEGLLSWCRELVEVLGAMVVGRKEEARLRVMVYVDGPSLSRGAVGTMPVDDNMTVDERRKYLKHVALRYAQATYHSR